MGLRPDLRDAYEVAIEGAVNHRALARCRVDLEEPVRLIGQAILERIAKGKLVIGDLTYERHFDNDSLKITYWEPGDLAAFRRDLIVRIQKLLGT